MKKTFYILIFIIINIDMYSQNGTIKGFVKDATNNEASPFANVFIEQINSGIATDIEGKFEFTINGKKHLCVKGSTFHIPSNVPHSGKAITSCVIMDVFSPKRDDLG